MNKLKNDFLWLLINWKMIKKVALVLAMFKLKKLNFCKQRNAFLAFFKTIKKGRKECNTKS